MTTTKDEAIKTLREALEVCRNMADSNNDGISFDAADTALAATSHIAPDAALPVVSDEMCEIMRFASSPAIAPEASELPPKLNYSASDDYKKWWDGNRAKLANHSIYTKGAVIWNAAIAMCQNKGSQHE